MQESEFNVQQCREFVEKAFMTDALPSLCKYITIQSKSKGFYKDANQWKDKGWNNLVEAAEHIKIWIDGFNIQGCTTQIREDKAKNRTPIILTIIERTPGVGTQNDTFLFYGHYDKQPPLQQSDWKIGKPYQPLLWPNQSEPEKLYGRGAADDGYAAYAPMIAIKALQDQKIPHPRCIMIIEGDEETGSGDAEYWVNQMINQLGTPKVIFCLDGTPLDYDRLWITTSLRGLCNVILDIQVLENGIHSGDGSGIIPNPFRILRQLLGRIENVQTGMMPAFDVDIPANRYLQLSQLVELKGKNAIRSYRTRSAPGYELKLPGKSILDTLILASWRAQLAATGMSGFPSNIAESGNVLLPEIKTKLSIRLPPTKSSKEAAQILTQRLLKNPPYNALITFEKDSLVSLQGFNAPEFTPGFQSILQESSKTWFEGQGKLSLYDGGTVPLMKFLLEKWPATPPQFVITGVLGPESNAHGIDQFLHIPYVKKLICSMASIIYKSTQLYFPPQK